MRVGMAGSGARQHPPSLAPPGVPSYPTCVLVLPATALVLVEVTAYGFYPLLWIFTSFPLRHNTGWGLPKADTSTRAAVQK